MRRAVLLVIVGIVALAGCAPSRTERPLVFSTTWLSDETG